MPNRERDIKEQPSSSGLGMTSAETQTETADAGTGSESVSVSQIRAVLDTSALVPSQVRRELQVATQAGLYVGYWSPWIIAELNRVLTWRWLQRTAPPDLSRANEQRCSVAAHIMMELLLATFQLVNPLPPYPSAWEQLADAWDHPIWAAAKASGAQYVVSENTHDYPPPQADGRHVYESIEYLGGEAFLQLLAGTDLE